MGAAEPARRPGGRSARVRAAVHQAVIDLLGEEGWGDLNVALVAERSGVHQTTIYRRWGNLTALIDDVVTERLSRSSPVPDTGTLRGDLEAYTVQMAEDVAGPMGAVFLRAAMISTHTGGEASQREIYLLERGVQIQAMLDRARDRGENPPTLLELMEIVQAPLYFHLSFFNRPVGVEHARALVDRLLALTENRRRQMPPTP
ncbi:TetR/AcrR family transcriptional regulator C-terminal ligand-binding domain-containing protein [Streptosporangium sp. NPDC000396]|uniref:TetR/AcrR family transcriptional regulator n=1 Tax=Streptosporangium sp. NPDC000396 TaxID=3366185 RepID=UPI0036B5DD02